MPSWKLLTSIDPVIVQINLFSVAVSAAFAANFSLLGFQSKPTTESAFR